MRVVPLADLLQAGIIGVHPAFTWILEIRTLVLLLLWQEF